MVEGKWWWNGVMVVKWPAGAWRAQPCDSCLSLPFVFESLFVRFMI